MNILFYFYQCEKLKILVEYFNLLEEELVIGNELYSIRKHSKTILYPGGQEKQGSCKLAPTTDKMCKSKLH